MQESFFRKIDRLMFSNIGTTIKKITRFLTWFNIVVGWIGCIVFGFYATVEVSPVFLFAIPVAMVISAAVFWFMSLPLYGFGEIIDRLIKIDRNTSKEESAPEQNAPPTDPRILKLRELHDNGLISDDEFYAGISRK